ncbi:hypothetical protein MYX64_08975 [Nitrospinae bacterium AH_259_B05_G02_I21]|nr:hypothetical protein [Nitrospinae bacterium AH_259_B05_G02_I21]
MAEEIFAPIRFRDLPNNEVIREIIEELYPEITIEEEAGVSTKRQRYFIHLSRKNMSEKPCITYEIAEGLREEDGVRLNQFTNLVREAARRLGVD